MIFKLVLIILVITFMFVAIDKIIFGRNGKLTNTKIGNIFLMITTALVISDIFVIPLLLIYLIINL